MARTYNITLGVRDRLTPGIRRAGNAARSAFRGIESSSRQMASGMSTATRQVDRQMDRMGASFRRVEQQARSAFGSMRGASLGNLGAEIGKLGNPINALRSGMAAFMAHEAVQFVGHLTEMGQEAIVTANVYKQLTSTIGGYEDALTRAREATGNVIDDTSLQQHSNRILQMGLADTNEELAKHLELASKLGGVLGQDVNSSIESWSLALSSGRYQSLARLGVDVDATRQRTAELKETEGLSQLEAFQTATIEQAEAALERLGDQAEAAITSIGKIQTHWDNFVSFVSEQTFMLMEKAAFTVSSIIDMIQGADVQDTIENFHRSQARGSDEFALGMGQNQDTVIADSIIAALSGVDKLPLPTEPGFAGALSSAQAQEQQQLAAAMENFSRLGPGLEAALSNRDEAYANMQAVHANPFRFLEKFSANTGFIQQEEIYKGVLGKSQDVGAQILEQRRLIEELQSLGDIEGLPAISAAQGMAEQLKGDFWVDPGEMAALVDMMAAVGAEMAQLEYLGAKGIFSEADIETVRGMVQGLADAHLELEKVVRTAKDLNFGELLGEVSLDGQLNDLFKLAAGNAGDGFMQDMLDQFSFGGGATARGFATEVVAPIIAQLSNQGLQAEAYAAGERVIAAFVQARDAGMSQADTIALAESALRFTIDDTIFTEELAKIDRQWADIVDKFHVSIAIGDFDAAEAALADLDTLLESAGENALFDGSTYATAVDGFSSMASEAARVQTNIDAAKASLDALTGVTGGGALGELGDMVAGLLGDTDIGAAFQTASDFASGRETDASRDVETMIGPALALIAQQFSPEAAVAAMTTVVEQMARGADAITALASAGFAYEPGAEPPGGGTYTVESGDTAISIARELDITLEAFKKLNPQIENFSRIFVGQEVNTGAAAGASGGLSLDYGQVQATEARVTYIPDTTAVDEAAIEIEATPIEVETLYKAPAQYDWKQAIGGAPAAPPVPVEIPIIPQYVPVGGGGGADDNLSPSWETHYNELPPTPAAYPTPTAPALPEVPPLEIESYILAPLAPDMPEVAPLEIESYIISPLAPDMPQVGRLDIDSRVLNPLAPDLPQVGRLDIDSRVLAPLAPDLPQVGQLVVDSYILAPLAPDMPEVAPIMVESAVLAPLAPDLPQVGRLDIDSRILAPLPPDLPEAPALMIDSAVLAPLAPDLPQVGQLVIDSYILAPLAPELPEVGRLLIESAVLSPLAPDMPQVGRLDIDSRVLNPLPPELPQVGRLDINSRVLAPLAPELPEVAPLIVESVVLTPLAPELPQVGRLDIDSYILSPLAPELPTGVGTFIIDSKILAPLAPTLPDGVGPLFIETYMRDPAPLALPEPAPVFLPTIVETPELPEFTDVYVAVVADTGAFDEAMDGIAGGVYDLVVTPVVDVAGFDAAFGEITGRTVTVPVEFEAPDEDSAGGLGDIIGANIGAGIDLRGLVEANLGLGEGGVLSNLFAGIGGLFGGGGGSAPEEVTVTPRIERGTWDEDVSGILDDINIMRGWSPQVSPMIERTQFDAALEDMKARISSITDQEYKVKFVAEYNGAAVEAGIAQSAARGPVPDNDPRYTRARNGGNVAVLRGGIR